MSSVGERNLVIVFKDFQLDLNSDFISDISCYVSVNSPTRQSGRYIDMILLSNMNSNRIKIPVPEPEEHLQFIFKRLKNSEGIGSISFSSAEYFYDDRMDNATQWITLFDDNEDDMYDGEFGFDDLEAPRVLVQFLIEDGTKKGQSQKGKKEVHIQPSGHQALNLHHDESMSKNSIRIDREDPDHSRQESLGRITFGGGALSGDREVPNQKDPEDLNAKFNDMLQNLKSADDLIQATREIDELREEKENPGLKMIKDKIIREDQGDHDALQEKLKNNEKEIASLRVEREKLKKLEERIASISENGRKYEHQYNELMESYKNSIDKNEKVIKDLMNDKKHLTDKVIELESSLKNQELKFTSKRKNTTDIKKEQEVELERLRGEKARLKSLNLSKVIEDLKKQNKALELSLAQEKERRNLLLIQYDEMMDRYKQNLEDCKILHENMRENNKKHEEDIKTLNEALTINHNKSVTLESKNKQLANELGKNKELISRLEKQLQSLNENISILSKELDDIKIAKANEVKSLSDDLNEAQIQITAIHNEKSLLTKEIEKLQAEKKKWAAIDQAKELNRLNELFKESETQRRYLQDELAAAHRQWKLEIETRIMSEGVNNPKQQQEINMLQSKLATTLEDLAEKNKAVSELSSQINEIRMKRFIEEERSNLLNKLNQELRELKETNNQNEVEKKKLQEDLYKITEELIKQTNANIESSSTVNKLTDEIVQLHKGIEEAFRALPKANEDYVPIKGDEIDRRLSVFLGNNPIPVKFIRVGEGIYTFGTKKIAIKILNGKLVIRVGGGYLLIDEFIRLYTMTELAKVKDPNKEESTGNNGSAHENQLNESPKKKLQATRKAWEPGNSSHSPPDRISASQQLYRSAETSDFGKREELTLELNQYTNQINYAGEKGLKKSNEKIGREITPSKTVLVGSGGSNGKEQNVGSKKDKDSQNMSSPRYMRPIGNTRK